MISGTKFIKQLKAKRGLPTPPGVALKLLELIRDGSGTTAEVANTLGCDPVLTSRILTYANSPLVGASNDVSSLHRAVTLLGMRRVAVLALSYCFVDVKQGAECPAFDCELFWQESVARAVTARKLAALVEPGMAEEAFVTGLVSDMGRLVLATGMPAEYQQILEQGGDRDALAALEKEQVGATADELCVALLQEWRFPERVTATVSEGQLLRSGADPLTESQLPRCLCIAQLSAEAIVHPSRRLDIELVEQVFELAGRCLGLGTAQWEAVFAACVEEWQGHCALDISSHDVKSFSEIETEAREQLAMLSIAAVTESEEMLERASTDTLTGIANRSAFNERLELEVERYRRKGGDLLLLMLDIDHFKSFNDTYGHQLGDTVIRMVAEAIDECVRRVDLAARYGGEEFAVIAPDCLRDHAGVLAERLRESVEGLKIEHDGKPLAVTISVGAAYARMAGCQEAVANDMIARADQQLYRAKRSGRNRCQLDPADLPVGQACNDGH